MMTGVMKYKLDRYILPTRSKIDTKLYDAIFRTLDEAMNDGAGWSGDVKQIQAFIQDLAEQANTNYAVEDIGPNRYFDRLDVEVTFEPYGVTPMKCTLYFTIDAEECIRADADYLNKNLN